MCHTRGVASRRECSPWPEQEFQRWPDSCICVVPQGGNIMLCHSPSRAIHFVAQKISRINFFSGRRRIHLNGVPHRREDNSGNLFHSDLAMSPAPDRVMPDSSMAAGLLATPYRLLASVLVLTVMLLSPLAQARQVCGLPGNDPGSTASGIVNSYFDGSNQATLATAATSLRLGAVRAGSATSTIATGD